ncbi:MAG: V4R domain-containing protein [Nitrososphaerales archaeon]
MRPAKYPKDVLLFLYDPDKKFVHVLVELRNERGALGAVAARVSRLGLNVINGLTSVEPGQPVGIWSFFAECVDKGQTASEIQKAIEDSKHVVSVRVGESEGGLLTDNFHFPLRFTPGRTAVGFNPTSIASMFRRVTDTYGSGGQVIVYEEGKAVGKEGGEFLLGAIGRATVLSRINRVGDLLSGWGWGVVESIEMNKGISNVKVRATHCFESSGEESAVPTCHFMRGMLEGLFETIAGHPMGATETACASQGHESCEFTIVRR